MYRKHYHSNIVYLYFYKIHTYPWGKIISKKFSVYLNLFTWKIFMKGRQWHAFLPMSAYIWSCMYLSTGIISDLAQSWQYLWRFFKARLKVTTTMTGFIFSQSFSEHCKLSAKCWELDRLHLQRECFISQLLFWRPYNI